MIPEFIHEILNRRMRFLIESDCPPNKIACGYMVLARLHEFGFRNGLFSEPVSSVLGQRVFGMVICPSEHLKPYDMEVCHE